MADNTILNLGAGGDTIASDDIAGVKHQRVKIEHGADGSATDVSSASPLPVTVAAIAAGDNNIGNVDLASAIPAGTNNIGDIDVLSIAAGDNNIGNVDVVTLPALPAGNNNIGDVDVASIVPGTGATNLGKAEDSAHTTGDVGVMILAVRQNSQVDLGADGDYIPPTIDDSGGLRVSIVAGAGSGGTASADDADFTAGTTQGTPIMGVREDTPSTVTDGDLGVVGITAGRGLKVVATDAAGAPLDLATVAALTNADALNVAIVDANGDQITSFGGAGGTSETDDAAFTAAADAGTPIMGFVTGDSVDSGDVGVVAMTAARALHTAVQSIAAGDNNIGNVDVVSLPASTNTIEVVGDAAHDAAAAGNPLTIGGVLDDAATDSVDEGDVGYLRMSANRVLYGQLRDAAGNERGVNVNASNQLTVAEGGAALTALQLIDNPVLVDDAAFTPATSSVMMAGFEADEASIDSVDEGDAGAARMTLDRKVIVTPQPHALGGLTIFRSLDLDETEEEVKGTPGALYGWYIANLRSTPIYVKFYNDTAANVSVGSTTPVMTLPIPANSTNFVAANALGAHGIQFSAAITVAATTGLADADTGAPGANECVVNLFYK